MQTEWNGRAEVRITRLRVCIIRGEQQWMKRKRPRWDWEKGETLSPSLKSVTNFPTAGKKLAREANARLASLCSITSTRGVAFSLLGEARQGPPSRCNTAFPFTVTWCPGTDCAPRRKSSCLPSALLKQTLGFDYRKWWICQDISCSSNRGKTDLCDNI